MPFQFKPTPPKGCFVILTCTPSLLPALHMGIGTVGNYVLQLFYHVPIIVCHGHHQSLTFQKAKEPHKADNIPHHFNCMTTDLT